MFCAAADQGFFIAGFDIIRRWRRLTLVVFEETPTFTRRVTALPDDDNYATLQQFLLQHPDAGDLLRGSGGFRKIRWSAQGRGKRGGVRVIYYWWNARDLISMVLIYAKNEQDDLTSAQLKALKRLLQQP